MHLTIVYCGKETLRKPLTGDRTLATVSHDLNGTTRHVLPSMRRAAARSGKDAYMDYLISCLVFQSHSFVDGMEWANAMVVMSDTDPGSDEQLISVAVARPLNSHRYIHIAGTKGHYEVDRFLFKDPNFGYHGRDEETEARFNDLRRSWWNVDPNGSSRDPLFIPLHGVCLQLAQKAISTGTSGVENNALTSLGDLWDVLRLRLEGEHWRDPFNTYLIHLQNNYYIPQGINGVEWDCEEEDELCICHGQV